ncbi:MAG: bifunctional DNA primase/polymerase [Parvularculaceae bacterium]
MTKKEEGPAGEENRGAPVEGVMSDNVPDTDVSSKLERAARAYVDRGFRLVRLRAGEKRPVSEKGWQNAEPAPHEFLPGENIGVQLGAKSGHIVDIDLDIPQARALSGLGCFFGHLPSFRRASLPPDAPGHRLVICKDAPDEVEAFHFTTKGELAAINALRLPKATVLELRAGRGFTVFPPSVIGGDPLLFGEKTPIPEMGWGELRRRAGLLAFVAFAAACYPPEGGRDWFCFYLAGALVHAGVDPETADEIVVAVARINGDVSPERRGKAKAAAEKRATGEAVTGLPAFLDHIGMTACEKRLREWLQFGDAGEKTVVPDGAIFLGPELHAVLREVESLFIERSGRIYRRHAELVRVSTLEEKQEEDGVVRHAGLVELRHAAPNWLAVEASRVGAFFRRGLNGPVKVEPPAKLMAMLHAVADESRFPVIRGLSMTPTLACERPGYDPESKLFLAFPEGMFPSAPMQPTREEAEAALARLAHPLREFPFISEAARSVALSGIISAVVRGEMRTCPLHMIDAPAAGTGKTKLAEIIGIMGTGVPPSGVTHSADGEENEKRLVSILRTGDPVVLIDNVSSDLEGDFLCAMLTNETVQARILGLSERVRLSTRVLMLATGNNIRLRGDMARRAVVCRLDAKMTNPEDRKFDFDPVADVKAARPQLVADALTVVRAYIAVGRPASLPSYGSFEDWDLVRGSLVWLGYADPAETRLAVKDDNPLVEERAEVLGAGAAHAGVRRRFTMADVDTSRSLETLRDKLARQLTRGDWDKARAGQLLRRHRDLPFMGVTLRSSTNRVGVNEWWIEGDPDPALVDRQQIAVEPF